MKVFWKVERGALFRASMQSWKMGGGCLGSGWLHWGSSGGEDGLFRFVAVLLLSEEVS